MTNRARDMVLGVLALAMLLVVAGCGGDGGSGSGPTIASYALTGTITHLDTGSLTISDGSQTLTLPQGATSFAFQPLANGSAYAVAVTTQPAGADCVVNNGSGTVNGSAVGNVAIICNTLVSQPLAIGVSASGSLASLGSRIFLPVSQVGGVATTINAILDTGSAGTALRAVDIFPASMVSANGFVFPAGQTSMTYNGVTVTSVVATREYGGQSANPVVQTGNLGFAQVTFGTGTTATTAMMPIFLIYSTTANGTAGPPTNFANIIGVNPDTGPIVVGGVPAGAATTICTPTSTVTCGLTSPLRYFSYASGVDKGFAIARVTFAGCDIMTSGSCPVTPSLTVGVTAATSAGFATTALSGCRTVVVTGTTGEPACSQVIPGVGVSSGGASFTGAAIFDSGYTTIRLSIPAGMSFPDRLPAGSLVRIAPPAGQPYEYRTGTGYLTTTIVRATSANDFTNAGIAFFAQNSLLFDYSRATVGWRVGS